MDVVRQRLTPTILSPRSTNVGPSWDEWWAEITADVHNASPSKLFRTQPHLYTTVSFLARNVAQLGLHTFERVDESDRQRDRTSTVARALAGTDGTMTTYELIFALVGDLMLYDRAYWFVGDSATLPSGFQIRRIPPAWVTADETTPFEVLSWAVSFGDKVVKVPANQMLAFTGYSPTSPLRGSSAVEALRSTLQEQVEAAEYRKQVWKRGGRVSAVIERPETARQWSDAARESFREDWYAKFTGRGPKAGGTPILEDGMKLTRIDFNAQEQQFVEAAKLSLVTVASAFHINPTMIGQNDGANYSNVREFRKMLYGDTLGPILAQIEARLNAFLLPMLGVDNERFYVEFNIAEKLQGNFEEQAKALQTATGAPYMLRSEARALMNLPKIDGADELVVPLNVLIGDQASPTDSGEQNEKALDVLDRQERVVRSRLGAKRDDWWDAKRWDAWLAEALEDYERAHRINTDIKAAIESTGDITTAFATARAAIGAQAPEEGS